MCGDVTVPPRIVQVPKREDRTGLQYYEQACAWSPPSVPLVTYSSLQVTDTGKHGFCRFRDLMQVVGGGATIVLWILADLLYEFIGRGFTAKTQLYLAKLFWTRDQQSPSHLGLLLPGFKPLGTGYESIYNAIISTRLTYFYKTGKFRMRFFGGFCWKPWFFYGLVFATFNYPIGMWYTWSHMCPETAGTINP